MLAMLQPRMHLTMMDIDTMMADAHHAMLADALRVPTARNSAPCLTKLEDGSFALTVSAPGVAAADLSVSAKDDTIKVDGETKTAAITHVVHWESRLPREADIDGAKATHVDGVLTISMPRKAAAEPTLIEVNVNRMDDEGSEDEEDAAADKKPYSLTIEAPGVAASEITIVADESVLNVKCQSKRAGTFARSYRLPRDAAPSWAKATHVDGLLSITVPKKADAEVKALIINQVEAAGGRGHLL